MFDKIKQKKEQMGKELLKQQITFKCEDFAEWLKDHVKDFAIAGLTIEVVLLKLQVVDRDRVIRTLSKVLANCTTVRG